MDTGVHKASRQQCTVLNVSLCLTHMDQRSGVVNTVHCATAPCTAVPKCASQHQDRACPKRPKRLCPESSLLDTARNLPRFSLTPSCHLPRTVCTSTHKGPSTSHHRHRLVSRKTSLACCRTGALQACVPFGYSLQPPLVSEPHVLDAPTSQMHKGVSGSEIMCMDVQSKRQERAGNCPSRSLLPRCLLVAKANVLDAVAAQVQHGRTGQRTSRHSRSGAVQLPHVGDRMHGARDLCISG